MEDSQLVSTPKTFFCSGYEDEPFVEKLTPDHWPNPETRFSLGVWR
jgi:hypothetical protein